MKLGFGLKLNIVNSEGFAMSKVSTRTVFSFVGRSDIDERCPGYSFCSKVLVFLGILADDAMSQRFDRVDEEIKSRGY